MNVLVAGAHGAVGSKLVSALQARGHDVTAGVRKENQFAEMTALGAHSVMLDLSRPEHFDAALSGADAVVFAAGSAGEAVEDVDRDGAIHLTDHAQKSGPRRFVMLSSIGVDRPEKGPEKLQPYLRAKKAADEHLAASDLDWTIVRPGGLTDDGATGRIRTGTQFKGDNAVISRADVAETLAEVLEHPGTVGKTFEIIKGDTPIKEAVAGM
ncbi:SDR family oxidoreductase [Maricaulaceae bacterium MS644]